MMRVATGHTLGAILLFGFIQSQASLLHAGVPGDEAIARGAHIRLVRMIAGALTGRDRFRSCCHTFPILPDKIIITEASCYGVHASQLKVSNTHHSKSSFSQRQLSSCSTGSSNLLPT